MNRIRLAKYAGVAIALALVTACTSAPSARLSKGSGHGPLTSYTLVLRYFGDRDAHAIMKVMAAEFPGYRSHNLLTKDAEVRRYRYRTTAKAFKLEEWLYLLLDDLGFDAEAAVRIAVDGPQIVVDQLSPKRVQARPPRGPGRPGTWVPITGDRFR